MSLFFFVYTLAILCICVSAATFCAAALAVTHRKRYILQAGFFVFYFLEMAIIFGQEWVGLNVNVIDAANYYAVDDPVMRIVLGACILACMWFVGLDIIDVHDWRPIAASTALVVVAQVLILVLMPYGQLRQWLFYTMRQISIAACLLYFLHALRTNHDTVFQQRMKKRRWAYLVMWLLTVGIMLEDSYIIFLAPIPTGDSNFAGFYLSSRNICENLMMVFLAAIITYRAVRDLALRYNRPPEMTEPQGRKAQEMVNHISDRLPRYAQVNGLSKREEEVLELALEGKSNREIASELILAEGTVKTHLHNIMKKCSVANRDELKQSFWSS